MVVSTVAPERLQIAEVAAAASAPPGSGMMVSPSRDTRPIWTPLCASPSSVRGAMHARIRAGSRTQPTAGGV